MGTPDYKDITNVLKAMNEIDHVQAQIPEAPNEEVGTPVATATKRLSTIERPSTSTAPARRGSRLPVATLGLSLPLIPLYPPHIHLLAPTVGLCGA